MADRSSSHAARLLVDVDASARRADENEIGGVAHIARRRRLGNNLRTDAANVAERDRESRTPRREVAHGAREVTRARFRWLLRFGGP